MLDKLFGLKAHGTKAKTELVAGLTTFMTMAYIIFVNPSILSATGMDENAVFVATILASAIATFIMAFVANVPYALAPGMGLNAMFTYTICLGMNIPWQQALAIVFICGIINIIITVTKIRKMIIYAIPKTLQYAISGGIGLFIAYIGLIDGHLLSFAPNSAADASGSYSAVVPAIVNFSSRDSILTLIGVVIIVILMILKVKGSILIGIIATTLIGIPMGLTTYDPKPFSLSLAPTFLKLDIAGLFSDPGQIFKILALILTFSIADTFDTIGTFLGTGRVSGIFDQLDEENLREGKGFSSRLDRALFADSTATSIGALLGTSNTTTYVESAAGIAAGGRTGMTSAVVGILFLLCLVLSPVAGVVPTSATAAALIVVGILMAESLGNIEWDNLEIAIPAFFTIVIMPLAYSITTGIQLGFLFYCIIMIFRKKAKEVHPIMYIVTAVFLLDYLIKALQLF